VNKPVGKWGVLAVAGWLLFLIGIWVAALSMGVSMARH